MAARVVMARKAYKVGHLSDQGLDAWRVPCIIHACLSGHLLYLTHNQSVTLSVSSTGHLSRPVCYAGQLQERRPQEEVQLCPEGSPERP